MSLALYPAIKLGDNQEKIRRSISRLTTGLNILAGATSGDLAEGVSLHAEGKSNQKVVSTTKVGLDLLKTAESALIELAALATRLREIGISDTVSSNSASDTAALNAEAIAVSDSIDDIVATAKFHNLAILSTSARTVATVKDVGGNTTTIKTTQHTTSSSLTVSSLQKFPNFKFFIYFLQKHVRLII